MLCYSLIECSTTHRTKSLQSIRQLIFSVYTTCCNAGFHSINQQVSVVFRVGSLMFYICFIVLGYKLLLLEQPKGFLTFCLLGKVQSGMEDSSVHIPQLLTLVILCTKSKLLLLQTALSAILSVFLECIGILGLTQSFFPQDRDLMY